MKTSFLAFLAVAVALVSLPARAASLDDANRAFAEGRYHDSTAAYQAVLAEKGYSAPVLYDLGNSYVREGNLAQAIVAYKRAQWLAPDDADITANLAYAQKQAGVTVTEPAWWEKYAGILSTSGWAWTACAAWTLFCASLLARAIWPLRRGLFAGAGWACALLLTLAIASIVVTSAAARQGVVIAKDASVLISPFPAAQSVFTPAPGETLTLHKTHDNFFWVSDEAGHSGWIAMDQVAPVVATGGTVAIDDVKTSAGK